MTLQANEGNLLIFNRLNKSEPLMIGRFGSIELSCFNSYLTSGMWDQTIKNQMFTNTGFFPATDMMLKKYCDLLLTNLSIIDIIAVWLYEEKILDHFSNSPTMVHLRSLEPYYHKNPWSQALKDKKILIIHPFKKSIENQFKIKNLLFQDPLILPDCELLTIKAVQSIAGTKTPFKDWFEAYDHMCNEISKLNFDIALIGAGSYGLPLAGFIKNMGKKAVHIGGALQILFGIKGKRWDEHEDISKLYNPYWVRPDKEEIPDNFIKIEEGCYW